MRKFAVLVVLTMLLASMSTAMAGGDKNRGEIGAGDTREIGCENQPCFTDAPQPGPSDAWITQASGLSADLDQAEIDALRFIREEEKMARDVYLVLYEKWGNRLFGYIAQSEQAHMDAMEKLLAFYGIEDPVTGDAIGVFTNDDIKTLFSYLKDWGLTSELDALLVGGYIEERDILDIWSAYDQTDEERIRRVYQNLYEGSYNHLDAFVHHYELLSGESYIPQLLSQEEYNLVMAYVTQAKQAQQPSRRKGK